MKPFSLIAVFVFGLIALMQFLRVMMDWVVVINGYTIPIWASAVASLFAAVLAVLVWRENVA